MCKWNVFTYFYEQKWDFVPIEPKSSSKKGEKFLIEEVSPSKELALEISGIVYFLMSE